MFQHKTVLLRETVDGLNIKPDGTYETAHSAELGIVHTYCSSYPRRGV